MMLCCWLGICQLLARLAICEVDVVIRGPKDLCDFFDVEVEDAMTCVIWEMTREMRDHTSATGGEGICGCHWSTGRNP